MPKHKDVTGNAQPKPAGADALPVPEPPLPAIEFEDPIGDVTDGEAHSLLADEAGTASTEEEEAPPEFPSEPAPPAKLQRLQKILSQAGIASRRHAEEMILAGRVIVNGQVVTTLGTKADPARDHIRVDGKLLAGAEHHRYFVLNKPKGFVTTVSDPEGRPTVMQFFAKMHERLYPVGRLDYQSEGLLLMTNDGDLANRLTRAASGVEKTYLVKIAGQPTAEQLELLRGGVPIERGAPGSSKVRTASARIRQIRLGENPWYEVVLIEGRNRELRKMFSGIGHFVEKIRRVGYGPLVLDLEPGKLRELAAEEVEALRLTAEGKLKPRRLKTVSMLPKEAGRPAGQRTARPPMRGAKPSWQKSSPSGKTEWKPRQQSFGGGKEQREPSRRAKPGFGPSFSPRPGAGPSAGPGAGPGAGIGARPGAKSGPGLGRGFGPGFRPGPGRPPSERPPSPGRPLRKPEDSRFHADSRPEAPPRKPFGKPGGRPAFTRPAEPRSRFGKAPGQSAGKALDRGAGKGPGRSFSQRPSQRPDRRPDQRPDQLPDQRPDQRPEKSWTAKPGQDRRRGPDKARSKRPESTWKKASSHRPARPQGSAPAFRNKARPAAGGKGKTSGKPFGFQGKPSAAKRSGPRPGGSAGNRRKRP